MAALTAPASRFRAALGRSTARVWTEARRLRSERVVPAIAALAAIALLLVETPLATARYGLALPAAFALAVLHTGALPAATRRPNLAAPLSLAAALVLQAFSASTAVIWPWWPVLIVTQSLLLATVATRTVLPVALLHWIIALGASALLAAWLRPDDGAETSIDLAVFGGVSAAAIVAGLLATQWRRLRSELLHERRVAAEEAERRVLMEERTRIARELHDVVAHGLSIITVQASTARFRHGDFSADAAAEFDGIAAQSRQALDEMRGLLHVLRGAEDGPRRPQPGLADVEELVARAESAGTPITFEEPPGAWATGVGPLTGLAAYRIVQEATSNALRHAPGSAVHVTLDRTAAGIGVAVVNSTPVSPVAAPLRAGHGLVGMAERAASVGGSVRFGPTDDGGFAVRATLPVAGRP